MKNATSSRRRRSWRGPARLALLLLLILSGMVLVAWREARRDPVVRRMTVRLPHWPAGAAPVRVALLSDIHIGGAATTPERLMRVVAQVNALHPDLVLLAGDFVAGADPVAGRRFAAMLRAPLAGLRAPLGTVAVLGNHDHWTAPNEIGQALEAGGAKVLANAAVKRGPLVLIGVDDGYSGHADVGRAVDEARGLDGARIVLTHTPDTARRMPAAAGRLLLAGHTHCGQVVLPVIGSLAVRGDGASYYDRRYQCGAIRDPARLVIVTGGIGGSLPLRLGAPPDLWLLTLGP